MEILGRGHRRSVRAVPYVGTTMWRTTQMAKLIVFGEQARRGLERGIELAVAAVTEALGNQARDVETREQIAATASISAADPAVGEIIAEAMDKVGKDGVITVEESNTFGLELELTEGMRFDKGYISPYFVTDAERMEAVLDDPHILVVENRVSNLDDLLPILEKAMRSDKPLVIIAEEVDGEALATLVVNKVRGTFKSV